MKPNSGACTESATSAVARRLAEPLGPRVVHPEAALEVDLAGVVAALEQERDRVLGVVAGGDPGKADAGSGHTGKLPVSGRCFESARSWPRTTGGVPLRATAIRRGPDAEEDRCPPRKHTRIGARPEVETL